MVHFINIPRTYSVFYCKHNHAEVNFNMLGNLFGYRFRSPSKVGIKNEVQCKVVYHNILMLACNYSKCQVEFSVKAYI
jgi:hypothetical protein